MTGDIRDPVVFALDGMEEGVRAALVHPMSGIPASDRELERLRHEAYLKAIEQVRQLWAEMANSSTAQIIAETMRSGPA